MFYLGQSGCGMLCAQSRKQFWVKMCEGGDRNSPGPCSLWWCSRDVGWQENWGQRSVIAWPGSIPGDSRGILDSMTVKKARGFPLLLRCVLCVQQRGGKGVGGSRTALCDVHFHTETACWGSVAFVTCDSLLSAVNTVWEQAAKCKCATHGLGHMSPGVQLQPWGIRARRRPSFVGTGLSVLGMIWQVGLYALRAFHTCQELNDT